MTTPQVGMPLPPPDEITFDSGQNVTRFKGKLISMTWNPAAEGRNPGLKFGFLELDKYPEELKSLTPWPYPQFEFVVPYSLNSPRWEAISESVTAIKGPGWKTGEALNKVLVCEWSGGHKGRAPDAAGVWQDTMIEAWVILEIDGARAQAQPVARMAAPVGGGSNGAPAVAVKAPAAETPDMSEDALLESVAIDVDDAEFQRKALNHPQIKGTPLFDLILSSGAGVLSSLVKSGALKKDDEGIWRKGGQ